MNRMNTLIKNAVGSCVIKGAGMIISFLLVPIYMNYFKNEQILGIWYTLIAFLNWIMFFDFGMGNALRNIFVKLEIKNDRTSLKEIISTTYFISICIALLIALVIALGLYVLDLNKLFNVDNSTIPSNILRFTLMITSLSVIMQFVLKNINSILQAQQRVAVVNLMSLASNVLILIFILISNNSNDLDNLINLSLIYLFTSVIPLIIATLCIFNTSLKDVKPNFNFIKSKWIRKLIGTGIGFLFLQLISLCLFNTNEFLLSVLISPKYVVEYQIYFKIYNFVASFSWIALAPLWSLITDAYEKKDFNWIRNTYRKSIAFLFLTVLLDIVITWCLPIIFQIWLQEDTIEVNYIYGIVFTIYNFLYVMWGIQTSFVNGMGKIKLQLCVGIFIIFLKFILVALLHKYLNDWIFIIMINIICMSIYCFLEPIHIRKILKSKC